MDGDFTKLHGVYVNAMDMDEVLEDEICSIFYDTDNGKKIQRAVDFGRMGELQGLFVAEELDVQDLIGKEVYFDEVLGKHSEINSDFAFYMEAQIETKRVLIMEERTTNGKRIVHPPTQRNGVAMMSVLLTDDEDVQWHYQHSINGSIITGYTIIKKGK